MPQGKEDTSSLSSTDSTFTKKNVSRPPRLRIVKRRTLRSMFCHYISIGISALLSLLLFLYKFQFAQRPVLVGDFIRDTMPRWLFWFNFGCSLGVCLFSTACIIGGPTWDAFGLGRHSARTIVEFMIIAGVGMAVLVVDIVIGAFAVKNSRRLQRQQSRLRVCDIR